MEADNYPKFPTCKITNNLIRQAKMRAVKATKFKQKLITLANIRSIQSQRNKFQKYYGKKEIERGKKRGHT